jgi:hypothetical protein
MTGFQNQVSPRGDSYNNHHMHNPDPKRETGGFNINSSPRSIEEKIGEYDETMDEANETQDEFY